MRYAPSTTEEQEAMLRAIGVKRFEDLLQGVPEHLRMSAPIEIPEGLPEMESRRLVKRLASNSRGAADLTCFAGAGVYDHFIPSAVDPLVSRSEFTTAYTPYQSEVSQGTLQVIYEFQSLIAELMGMDVANASLYDGAHSLAEAMLLAHDIRKSPRMLVSDGINPYHRRVLETYAAGMDIELVYIPLGADGRTDTDALNKALKEPAAAFLFAQPNFSGCIEEAPALASLVRGADEKKPPLMIVSVYPTSLGLLAPPGQWGADVAVAEGQSLGLPMSLGGPFLGLFAAKQEYIRRMPGRLIGRTVDRDGRLSYVLTLQTREQHIRRAKATSNICTNQGLFALWATVYMTLIGPEGLREVASSSAAKAHYLAGELTRIDGVDLTFPDTPFFNEFNLSLKSDPAAVLDRLVERGYLGGVNLTRFEVAYPGQLLVAVTERRTREQLDAFIDAFQEAAA
ncbi:aminomethyl-transferring glycine dehydrogenase subunit GcvPA [Gemmatimonadota bacterium]